MYLNRVPKGNFLVKTVLKNNIVFNEGSKGDTAYILSKGTVEISGRVDGRKKVFAILKPVSVFGEMALFLEDQARTATAMALEDCQLVTITRDDLDNYMAEAPQIISTILDVLVLRLKSTTKKALKVPNTPMGVVRILDMFAANDYQTLRYDSAVRTLSDIFLTNPVTIEKILYGLAEQGHLSIEAGDGATRHITLISTDLVNDVRAKKA